MKKLIFGLLLLSSINIANAERINDIELVGNKRVQDAVVLSSIPYTQGSEYKLGLEKEVVKSVFETGLFADVVVDWNAKDQILKVKLKENPQINKIAFEGNEEIADSILKKKLELKPRSIYSSSKISNDVKLIEKMYQLKGFYLAKVSPEYIQRDQNRIDLIYKINEGDKTLIQKINFIGNKAFSNADLKAVISSKVDRFWRVFTSSTTYDEQRIAYDAEQIRRFYHERGFADFSIREPLVELTPNKKGFIVTFNMTEGVKYTFSNIDVDYNKNIIDIDLEEISKLIDIEKGQVYSSKVIEKNIDRLVDYLSNLGYAFTDVVPMVRKNQDTRQASLVFQLKPGRKIYVNRINIEGNTRTQDNVIRRQLRLSEGDALQGSKLKRSKDRLTYTDYFSKVDIKPEETSTPDKIDLNVEVEEKNTGEFNVGAGVSSYEGLIATMDVKENNFLGKGQRVRLGFSLSSKRKNYNLGITEPWFMGRELSASVDVYAKETSYDSESSYDEKTTGVSFGLGFPVDEYKRDTIKFKAENKDVTDVDDDASLIIKDQEGEKTKLALSNTFSIDTRDNQLMPTKGYNTSWTVEYAGFGADIEYVKNVVRGSYNYSLEDDLVLTLAGRTGYLWDINSDSPITENFRLGGATLRGFAPSGIGPRDRDNNDALGGQFMIGHNVELRYPLPGMRDSGINGLFFWDGGLVTSVNDKYDVVEDSKTYRQSLGTGIFWRSPLGPLRFAFGVPIVSSDEDEKEIFSFSFGTRF
jgi:outer membrane protein insertion porin family